MMRSLEREARKLYRMTDKIEDVNWSSQYLSNIDMARSMLPDIYNFTENAIKTVTYDENSLGAVIGLSGGIDSCVCSSVVAETMQNAVESGHIRDTNLGLINFRGRSKEDTNYSRLFIEYIRSKYPRLKIQYIEQDIIPLLNHINEITDYLLNLTHRKKIYPGELATRLMDLLVLEYADKTGHCAIDSTNKTEVVLGEIVIGAGGEAAILSDFYKTQVYDLAEALAIPDPFIQRRPINSTFATDKVSSYFAEIPTDFTPGDVYRVLDLALFLAYDKKYSSEALSHELGHSEKFTQKLWQRIHSQDHRRVIPSFNFHELPSYYNSNILIQ